ncbi:MAG: response regulator transcription factor [Chloroflexi bacterium]|nr:response regulator transcription factor [Chloroflexota bacterium]
MVAWKSDPNIDDMQTVLIVSQDAEMVMVWETLFEQKNYHVVCEAGAEDALQTARLLSPALIILDLDLTPSERIGLCRELRSTTGGTLLLLAPKRDEAEIFEYLYAGVDEFLSTPISPLALLVKSMAWLVRQEWIAPSGQSSQVYVL